MEEQPKAEGTPAENPTSNPDLGRFKSLEAKQRSLQNLRPPFQPGQPAPAGAGRPRSDGPATKELRRLLRKKFPKDPQQRSYLKLVVESLVKQAIRGNVFAQQLLWERLEGRVPLPTETDMPCNITLVVNRNVPQEECGKDRTLLLEGRTSDSGID